MKEQNMVRKVLGFEISTKKFYNLRKAVELKSFL